VLTTIYEANGTDFSFTDYSDEYFPPKEKLHTYLGDYVNKFNLIAAFNTEVENISHDQASGDFQLSLEPNPGFTLQCGIVIYAGGLGTPRMFENELITPYHDASVDPNFYFNKSVAIVGAGQSAFECKSKHRRLSMSPSPIVHFRF